MSASEAEEVETDIEVECPTASDSSSRSSAWGGTSNLDGSGQNLPKQFDQGLPGTLKSTALQKRSSSSTSSSSEVDPDVGDYSKTPEATDTKSGDVSGSGSDTSEVANTKAADEGKLNNVKNLPDLLTTPSSSKLKTAEPADEGSDMDWLGIAKKRPTSTTTYNSISNNNISNNNSNNNNKSSAGVAVEDLFGELESLSEAEDQKKPDDQYNSSSKTLTKAASESLDDELKEDEGDDSNDDLLDMWSRPTTTNDKPKRDIGYGGPASGDGKSASKSPASWLMGDSASLEEKPKPLGLLGRLGDLPPLTSKEPTPAVKSSSILDDLLPTSDRSAESVTSDSARSTEKGSEASEPIRGAYQPSSMDRQAPPDKPLNPLASSLSPVPPPASSAAASLSSLPPLTLPTLPKLTAKTTTTSVINSTTTTTTTTKASTATPPATQQQPEKSSVAAKYEVEDNKSEVGKAKPKPALQKSEEIEFDELELSDPAKSESDFGDALSSIHDDVDEVKSAGLDEADGDDIVIMTSPIPPVRSSVQRPVITLPSMSSSVQKSPIIIPTTPPHVEPLSSPIKANAPLRIRDPLPSSPTHSSSSVHSVSDHLSKSSVSSLEIVSKPKLSDISKTVDPPSKSTSNSPHPLAGRNFADQIPTFYVAKTAQDGQDERRKALHADARNLHYQRLSEQLPSNELLANCRDVLYKHSTLLPSQESTESQDGDTDEAWIGYAAYGKVRTLVHPAIRPMLTNRLFATLQYQRDSLGRVPAKSIFGYVMRRTWLMESRLALARYDTHGNGYLTETDVETYIKDLIPTVPQLAKLEKSFFDFYVCTAVRKFMFFLDPKRLGRVRIADIVASGFLDDLHELRDKEVRLDDPLTQTSNSLDASGNKSDKSGTSGPERTNSARSVLKDDDQNWFSADSASRVYYQYLNLDRDHNGMLSLDELKEYGTGTLTMPFLTRLFQECVTYRTNDTNPSENEMDYKSYLDFVLAMENKSDRASLEYFMRILDVRQLGYLDGFAFNYFFRAIYDNLVENAQHDDEIVDFFDVKDEIFDMTRPVDKHKITLQDLIKSKQGDTVVNILIDTDGFWRYDNRELLNNDDEDEQDV